MRRLPLRARVASAFVVAMAVVLAGTGVYLYVRLDHDLRNGTDRDLGLRADDVAALLRAGGSLRTPGAGQVELGESFAQLLDGTGHVIDASPTVASAPLLGSVEIEAARSGPRYLDRSSVEGLDEPARILALPLERPGTSGVLVVGATVEDRAEALADLRQALFTVGPLALLLATGAGYVLAGSGLRAVETMRRHAAEISASRPGERLPVPATSDELERLGHTLNAMLERLEAALERERSFVADAGHELRTPLTLLRAELDLALRGPASEAELREATRRASEETDRLVQLAGDLLLIASTDQGRLPLRSEEILATPLLESVRNRFAWRAADAGRRLAVEAPPGLRLVGDRLRLEQALGNLVENALRHGAGDVLVAADATTDAIEVSVSDEGPGFPESFLGRAFERFSRPDEGRTGSGTGLGLAIVDAIARAHDGTAQARNLAAGGAVVVVRLPRLPPGHA